MHILSIASYSALDLGPGSAIWEWPEGESPGRGGLRSTRRVRRYRPTASDDVPCVFSPGFPWDDTTKSQGNLIIVQIELVYVYIYTYVYS